mmetsp:Transcript_26671/g.50422  ORF Transcript_26671/g.50422 Transcript_26671/m.50422 type:complete len:231 (-) Transcript_26671:1173-1865(-)
MSHPPIDYKRKGKMNTAARPSPCAASCAGPSGASTSHPILVSDDDSDAEVVLLPTPEASSRRRIRRPRHSSCKDEASSESPRPSQTQESSDATTKRQRRPQNGGKGGAARGGGAVQQAGASGSGRQARGSQVDQQVARDAAFAARLQQQLQREERMASQRPAAGLDAMQNYLEAWMEQRNQEPPRPRVARYSGNRTPSKWLRIGWKEGSADFARIRQEDASWSSSSPVLC